MYKFSYLLFIAALMSCGNKNSEKDNSQDSAKAKQVATVQSSGKVVYGKYGCTASSYKNGSVEYSPKGFFTITSDGTYTYEGFEKPRTGTFTEDKDGNLFFKDGYFDGGKAEKIDRPNKFFVTFPANPDNRWTAGLVEDK